MILQHKTARGSDGLLQAGVVYVSERKRLISMRGLTF